MKFQVAMKLGFSLQTVDEGEAGYGSFEEFLDAVMEELLALGFQEPSIGGSLEAMQIEISVEVEADAVEKAVVYGASSIRSALHAAHGSTHGWETYTTRHMDAWPLDEPNLQDA